MEKVIAFKAFNGRLFETEEKCLAYEKKYSEYPKVKYSKIPLTEGVEKCVKSIWEKPSSQRKDISYYLVGDKIKLFSFNKENFRYDLKSTDIMKQYHQPLSKIAANVILNNGVTFNTELAEKVCEIYNECLANQLKQSPYKVRTMIAEITETDNKTYWEIEDKSWRSGFVSPDGRYIRIEI